MYLEEEDGEYDDNAVLHGDDGGDDGDDGGGGGADADARYIVDRR